MSNTINIGGIEVSKFYLGSSSDVKIYLGTTKLYPHLQEPCFAVVADISQYSDRTYVDVYNQADDKWYKLNNLNQYEEYGIYGSGRTICTGASFTELTDIIAQSTTALTNHNITVTPAVGAFSKIRIDTTKSATTSSYTWATFTPTPNGSEVLGINMDSIGAMNGYGNNKNYVTDANGSQTFAHWVDNNHTIVEIDIAALSNNQASELYLLFYQENCNPAAFSFYIETNCVTTYDGKLTIDDGYEYMYSGGSWINLGEVSGSTQIIKSPEYLERNSSYTGRMSLDYVWKANTKLQFKFYSTNNGGGAMIGESGTPDNNDCRVFFASTNAYFDYGSGRITWNRSGRTNTLYEYEYGNYYIKNMVTSAIKTGTTFSTNRTNTLYFGLGNTDYFRTYYLKFYEGDTLVKDFIPWTDTNGNYGLYEKVSNTIYSATSGSFTASSVWNDVEVGGGYIYPLEYVVREDPPDNLTFSSMAEAEAYECPWVGMKATIDGDKYVFSGDSTSGYEWVLYSRIPSAYTEVEYVQNTGQSTVNLGIQLMATANVPYSIVLDNEMSYTSSYGDLQTFLTCCEEIPTVYPGWYYRYNNSSTVAIAGSDGINLSTGRTLVSGSTYHITITGNTNSNRTHNYPLNLFSSLDSNKSPWRFCKGKLYNMQVTYNNTLVRDLVPCYRKNDNVAGLYDIVNNVFYTSESGYDALVAGNPV